MSNSKNSKSCTVIIKEDELPDLNNINVQNISHDNKENHTKLEEARISHQIQSGKLTFPILPRSTTLVLKKLRNITTHLPFYKQKLYMNYKRH